MRRLLVLVSSIVFVDAMLFGALSPLVPGYADEFDLSKAAAGVLVGSFGAGAFVGGVPGGIAAARFGPRRTVLVGLALFALASFAFAVAGSAWTLGASRFLQGFASTTTWAGALTWLVVGSPRKRRGEVLGIAFGAAVLGAILGPMFGAVAHAVGIGTAFAATGCIGLGLAAWATASTDSEAENEVASSVGRAFRDERFVGGLWLNTLPGFLFGRRRSACTADARRGRLGTVRDRRRLLVCRPRRGGPEPAARAGLGSARPPPPHAGRARRLGRRRDRPGRRRAAGDRGGPPRRSGGVLRRILHARDGARLRPGRRRGADPGSR